jgi:hypothetical protein
MREFAFCWAPSRTLGNSFVAQGTVDRPQTNNRKFASHQRQTALNSILSFICSWIRLPVFTLLHFFPHYPPLLSASLPFTFPNSFHSIVLYI